MSSFNRNQNLSGDAYSQRSSRTGQYSQSGQSGYRQNTYGGQDGYSPRTQGFNRVSCLSTGSNSPSWRAGSVSDNSSVSSASTGLSTSTVNSKNQAVPKRKSVSEQIEDWARSPNTDDQLIEEYKLKATIFDSPNPKFQRDNFTNFINNLSRYRRVNLLRWYLGNKIPELIESMKKEYEEKKEVNGVTVEEIIKNSFDSEESLRKRFVKNSLRAYSPLNLVIYPKDKVITTQIYQEIITVINILVDYGFGFISRKMRKDKSEYEETLFEALYYEKNPIPLEYQHMIFDYFMYEFDNENFWIDSFKSVTNRIGKFDSTKSEFKELIYFLGMRCTNSIVLDQFNSLLREQICIDEHAFSSLSVNIIQYWINQQSFPNSIYNRYYQDARSEIASKPEQIIGVIVSNGVSIIESKLRSYEYRDYDEADLSTIKSKDRSGHFRNFLFVLGMFYSMGYYQTEILQILDSILCGNDGENFMMLIFTHFILGGKIDMNSMDIGLRRFVAKFINKVYDVKTGKKITGFSLFDTILTIKLLKLKGNSTEFFKNLTNPDIVIKYTCKASPFITLSPVQSPKSTSESTAINKTSPSLGNNSYGKLLEDSDDELEELVKEVQRTDFNFDDLDDEEEQVKEDEDDLSWLDEFEDVQMVQPDSELVNSFTCFVENSEPEDGIEYINEKLNKLSKYVLNEQMAIAIIMTLYSRQKPYHIMMLKKFISQTQSPDVLVSVINQLMSEKKIVDSIKNDHDFPQVEKYVKILLE